MKSLLLDRVRVACYNTSKVRLIESVGIVIELYANTSFFEDGEATYYYNSDVDANEIYELGTFDNFEDAVKCFDDVVDDLITNYYSEN